MQTLIDPDQIISELKDGNKRFCAGTSIHSNDSSLKKLKEFAKQGQNPKAIVLCCSDSRAPVELIFDQDIGDLFVIRVAGNVVAPSLVGSVEFAASTYGTRLVLVMGHSQCGAIAATLKYIEQPEDSSADNIHDIVSRITPHVYTITRMPVTNDEKMHLAVESNVMASVSQLSSSSRLIEQMVADGQIKIFGAVLDLNTGEVDFLK